MVALLACGGPTPVMAQGAPVVNVITFDVGGNLPGFLEDLQKGRVINDRLQTGGTVRYFQSTLAGSSVGNVTVGVEYPNLEAMAAATTKQNADPEWQQFVRDTVSKYEIISNSLIVDVTPPAR